MFVHYSCLVIILFITDIHVLTSFKKLVFCLFCFEFDVIFRLLLTFVWLFIKITSNYGNIKTVLKKHAPTEICMFNFFKIITFFLWLEGEERLKYCCICQPPDVHFSCFRPRIPFFGKFGPKIKIVSLSWNLVPRLIPIRWIQWEGSLFLFSTRNTLFWVNLVQKIKIVNSRWNLVLRLIWTCRIQFWCSLFLFFTRNTLFGYIWSKILKLLVSAEIWYINSNIHNSIAVFTFSVLDPEYPFLAYLIEKINNC